MKKIEIIEGTAVPLMAANIDTDVISPGEAILNTDWNDLGRIAFQPLRFAEDGSPDPAFPLNQARYQGAKILITGANFGCGSSRETAVWAIAGLGIGCIIAESFGDIFYANCFQNGVVPVRLPGSVVAGLAEEASAQEAGPFTIDIRQLAVIAPSGRRLAFELSADRCDALLQGLDDIGMTLKHAAAIERFQDTDRRARPWIHAAPWVSG